MVNTYRQECDATLSMVHYEGFTRIINGICLHAFEHCNPGHRTGLDRRKLNCPFTSWTGVPLNSFLEQCLSFLCMHGSQKANISDCLGSGMCALAATSLSCAQAQMKGPEVGIQK
eukprot:104362-Pelagomonas_calceolata.AAC.12